MLHSLEPRESFGTTRRSPVRVASIFENATGSEPDVEETEVPEGVEACGGGLSD